MSTLQENFDAIKLDTDTNLKPENLKAGVTCLGVNGTLEAGGGSSNVRIFNTFDELDSFVKQNKDIYSLLGLTSVYKKVMPIPYVLLYRLFHLRIIS